MASLTWQLARDRFDLSHLRRCKLGRTTRTGFVPQAKVAVRPTAAPFADRVTVRIYQRSKVLICDLRLLCQAEHQLGALNLYVRRMTQGYNLAGFFKLFGCKGRLVLGMASTRHRAFLSNSE